MAHRPSASPREGAARASDAEVSRLTSRAHSGGKGKLWYPRPPPSCCLRFPSDLLLTSSSGELWRMVRIGGQPLGFGEGLSLVSRVVEGLGPGGGGGHVFSPLNF